MSILWKHFQSMTPPNATSQRVDFASSTTRSAPNARPIELYLAHSWVSGRSIGVVGVGSRRVGRRCEGTRSQVSKVMPSHLNSSHPAAPHLLGYHCRGAVSPWDSTCPSAA